MNTDLMFQPLRKYADFQGRARRSEYWLFVLFYFVVAVVFNVLIGVLGRGNILGMLVTLVYAAFALGMLVPSLAVGFRRLHDTDRSAWWLLIALIPLLGGLALLVFMVLPGTPGPNKYGPDPKATPGDVAAAFA